MQQCPWIILLCKGVRVGVFLETDPEGVWGHQSAFLEKSNTVHELEFCFAVTVRTMYQLSDCVFGLETFKRQWLRQGVLSDITVSPLAELKQSLSHTHTYTYMHTGLSLTEVISGFWAVRTASCCGHRVPRKHNTFFINMHWFMRFRKVCVETDFIGMSLLNMSDSCWRMRLIQ